MSPSLTGHIASEDGSVERPAIALLQDLGWTHLNLMRETAGPTNPTGRSSFREVHLSARLRAALKRLKPTLPPEALTLAEAELTRDRSAMLPVAANREVHRLLVNGVAVEVRRPDGRFEALRARVIDWRDPGVNDFVIASQVWIESPLHKRRPDTIGYVNGLPLWVAEWKAPTQPLAEGAESRTREVFGDYVSIYDFAQSVADGATVPLYYESRKPELQLQADDLREELDQLLDEAALDEAQEARLKRQFARQYHLITRDDRLDKVADDMARHLLARGYRGKAMFVAIDKATAVQMHLKVRLAFDRLRTETETALRSAGEAEGAVLLERLEWIRSLDMAVVVSQGQNEIADLEAIGLDIRPHRARMLAEDLEAKFKDPADPFRLVFVRAMWITGFDAPTIGAIYLDNPTRTRP